MKSFSSLSVFLAITALSGMTLSSCASKKVNSDIDARLQAQPNVTTYEQFGKNARTQIKDSDASNEQKAQLLQLQRDTQDQSIRLREDYYKLRSLLIEDLSAKNYNQDEVDEIKVRLKKIEEQRLQLLYKAVDKASAILGRDRQDQNAKLIRTFDFEGHGDQ